jgi:hypothetical protein
LAIFVSLLAILNFGYRKQEKRLLDVYTGLRNMLDGNIAVYREKEDVFISENIEEINAAIEEILQNRAHNRRIQELIEVEAAPKPGEVMALADLASDDEAYFTEEQEAKYRHDEDDEPAHNPFESVYEEEEEEEEEEEAVQEPEPEPEPEPVHAHEEEEEETDDDLFGPAPQTEEERDRRLLELVIAVDSLIQYEGTTQEDIEQCATILFRAQHSKHFADENIQWVFEECFTILATAYEHPHP